MPNGPVIWVEGIIGAGKSELTKRLAAEMDLRAIYEPVDDNPYLAPYYAALDDYKVAEAKLHEEDGDKLSIMSYAEAHRIHAGRIAFDMQMHMLVVRYSLQKLAVAESLTGRGAVLDRGLPGDRVFASMMTDAGFISELEWATYQRAYDIMTADLRPPSVILFLDVDPAVALARANGRGRGVESGLTLEYMTALHRGYLDLLSQVESGNHAWSRGMSVVRVPWNRDHQDLGCVIEALGASLPDHHRSC